MYITYLISMTTDEYTEVVKYKHSKIERQVMAKLAREARARKKAKLVITKKVK
jgi:hypothetical protein